MDEIIEQIRQLALENPDLKSDLNYGPSTEREVSDAEYQLRTKFPRSFRAYLLAFSGGMFLNYEIYGIPNSRARFPGMDSGSLILDIVRANKKLSGHFPEGLVFICDDGGDFSFFLNTIDMDSEGECPVLMFGPGADGMTVADSFLSFLRRLALRGSFSE
jgi:hypothetical protein